MFWFFKRNVEHKLENRLAYTNIFTNYLEKLIVYYSWPLWFTKNKYKVWKTVRFYQGVSVPEDITEDNTCSARAEQLYLVYCWMFWHPPRAPGDDMCLRRGSKICSPALFPKVIIFCQWDVWCESYLACCLKPRGLNNIIWVPFRKKILWFCGLKKITKF